MAINISTLFADIIDTPEQRQQKLLQQGMMQGQLLSSGLQGRARAAAPLAQMAGQLGVQRNEDLRRAVQPMLGLDPRTRGEKLEEQLSNIDTSTPDGLLQAAQAIQSIDPLRAATLRQAAVEQRKADEERKLTMLGEKQRQELARKQDLRADTSLGIEEDKFKMFKDEHTTNLERLKFGLASDKEEQALKATMREGKLNYEQAIADSLGNTDADLRLREGILSSGFTMDTLSKIGAANTEFVEVEIQTMGEDGQPVNQVAFVDKNDPTAEPVIIKRSANQPDPIKLDAIPNITPRVSETIANVIDNTPALADLVKTVEEGTFFDTKIDAKVSRGSITDLLHTMKFRHDLTYQQGAAVIANTPIENLALGQIDLNTINAAKGLPPVNVGAQESTSPAMDEVLTNPEFADFVIRPQGQNAPQPPQPQQPLQPQPQSSAVSNAFNIALNAQQPAAPQSFAVAPEATGYDAEFANRLKAIEQGVREGKFSQYRVDAVKKEHVAQLKEDLRKAKNEERYFGGLKSNISQRDERLAATKRRIRQIEDRIQRYDTSTRGE